MNDKTQAVCDAQECTDCLADTGFMPAAQATVVRAFGMGAGAWALWVNSDSAKVRIRHYDARMVVPLTWDKEGVTGCAFVTRAFYRGKAVDQLQMHLRGREGYRIETVCFDGQGNEVAPVGVCPVYETGSEWPTFAIVKPEVMSTEDTIQEFATQLRTDAQAKALRTALQMLGDLCGFGITYFDFDGAGYMKTLTEVSSDNLALMRNETYGVTSTFWRRQPRGRRT